MAQKSMHRTYYLDNVCCVMILYMIYIYHIAGFCGVASSPFLAFVSTTLSFFMAWFFFKGGMMHKVISTKEIARKSAIRLLVPYFVFLILGFIIDSVIYIRYNPDSGAMFFVSHEIADFLRHTTLHSTGVCWFLLSLFVARTVFNALCTKFHPLLLTMMFACAAYAVYIATSHGFGFNLHIGGNCVHVGFPTYYMGNMCHGLAAYSLGFYLREKQFETRLFALAAIVFALKYWIPAVVEFRYNSAIDNNYPLAILCNMGGCIVVNNLFRRWVNMKLPLVSYIGENSMVYYLIHFPFVVAIVSSFLWEPLGENGVWFRFFVVSLVVTIALIIADFIFKNRKLRFLIGG